MNHPSQVNGRIGEESSTSKSSHVRKDEAQHVSRETAASATTAEKPLSRLLNFESAASSSISSSSSPNDYNNYNNSNTTNNNDDEYPESDDDSLHAEFVHDVDPIDEMDSTSVKLRKYCLQLHNEEQMLIWLRTDCGGHNSEDEENYKYNIMKQELALREFLWKCSQGETWVEKEACLQAMIADAMIEHRSDPFVVKQLKAVDMSELQEWWTLNHQDESSSAESVGSSVRAQSTTVPCVDAENINDLDSKPAAKPAAAVVVDRTSHSVHATNPAAAQVQVSLVEHQVVAPIPEVVVVDPKQPTIPELIRRPNHQKAVEDWEDRYNLLMDVGGDGHKVVQGDFGLRYEHKSVRFHAISFPDGINGTHYMVYRSKTSTGMVSYWDPHPNCWSEAVAKCYWSVLTGQNPVVHSNGDPKMLPSVIGEDGEVIQGAKKWKSKQHPAVNKRDLIALLSKTFHTGPKAMSKEAVFDLFYDSEWYKIMLDSRKVDTDGEQKENDCPIYHVDQVVLPKLPMTEYPFGRTKPFVPPSCTSKKQDPGLESQHPQQPQTGHRVTFAASSGTGTMKAPHAGQVNTPSRHSTVMASRRCSSTMATPNPYQQDAGGRQYEYFNQVGAVHNQVVQDAVQQLVPPSTLQHVPPMTGIVAATPAPLPRDDTVASVLQQNTQLIGVVAEDQRLRAVDQSILKEDQRLRAVDQSIIVQLTGALVAGRNQQPPQQQQPAPPAPVGVIPPAAAAAAAAATTSSASPNDGDGERLADLVTKNDLAGKPPPKDEDSVGLIVHLSKDMKREVDPTMYRIKELAGARFLLENLNGEHFGERQARYLCVAKACHQEEWG